MYFRQLSTVVLLGILSMLILAVSAPKVDLSAIFTKHGRMNFSVLKKPMLIKAVNISSDEHLVSVDYLKAHIGASAGIGWAVKPGQVIYYSVIPGHGKVRVEKESKTFGDQLFEVAPRWGCYYHGDKRVPCQRVFKLSVLPLSVAPKEYQDHSTWFKDRNHQIKDGDDVSAS